MVAIAAVALADRVEAALDGAEKVERKELKADADAVKADVVDATAE